MSRFAVVVGGNRAHVFAALGLAQSAALEGCDLATPVGVAIVYADEKHAAGIHEMLGRGLSRVAAVLPANTTDGAFSVLRPAFPGEAEKFPPPSPSNSDLLSIAVSLESRAALGSDQIVLNRAVALRWAKAIRNLTNPTEGARS